MAIAKVNGQGLFYSDSGGSGAPILLSHGFLMNESMFAEQVKALSPTYRVVTWDQRGFGQTEWDGKPFSYWDSASDALELLDHLGIKRAVFGGMSQGGFLSLRAALKAPERVRALVLFSSQAGVDPPEMIVGYKQMMDTWLNVGPVDPLMDTVAHILLGQPEHWEPWRTGWKTLPKDHLKEAAACLFERDDISDKLGGIGAPSIVFHGMLDQAIPMERAEALAARLPGQKKVIRVEGAAHATNLTHAALVNPPLLDFLRALPD